MTRLSLGAWVCAVAACAMMLAVIAWGQTGTASIYLEVVDPKGLAVVGAKVTLTSADTKASRTEVTDSTGIFLFPALAPGQYSVRVENAGFRSYVQGVELFVNTTHKIKAQLEVGAVTETIRVTEVGVVLNTTDATMGNVITPQQVASLPLEARSPVALLTLQPGVVFSGDPNDNRSGAVNGARSDQVNVTLDGVDANDQQKDINLTTAPFSTAFTPGLQIPLESIQEFRITTSNPNADQGRSSGGQIGFVTKSGTNEFHGSAFWTHRNTATTANDFFNNLATPRVPVPKLIRNQFGGSAGGPILRQRFFFFAAYEGNRRREESNELRIIPTDSLRQGFVKYTDSGGNVVTLAPADIKTIDPAGLGINPAMLQVLGNFPRASTANACNDLSQGLDKGLNFCGFRFNAPIALRNNVYVAKLDYHLTRDARHLLFWRGTLGNLAQDSTPQQFPGQPIAQKFLDNSKGYVVSYTAQLWPNLTNVVRYGYTRQGREFSGQSGPSFLIRSFDRPFSSARASIRLIPTHNLVEDLAWTRGTHTFQFGTNIRWIRNNRTSLANAFPDYQINDGFCTSLCNSVPNSLGPGRLFPQFAAVPSTSLNPFKRALMGLYGIVTTISSAAFFSNGTNTLASGQGSVRQFVVNEYEFYGQDSWRMTRNLTVTFGLRYGYYGVPYEANGLQTQPNVDIMAWFKSRAAAMLAGLPSSSIPLLSWDLAGPVNHKPGYYRPDKNNFAPNLSFAYSPAFQSGWLEKIFGGPGKSVIRGGGRVVYDRIGGSFVVTQDLNGSVGLVSPLSNAAGLLDYGGPACTTPPSNACMAPRFAGLATLPSVANFVSVPSAGFPANPASSFGNSGFVIDNGLRTPYAYAFDLSYGRELRGGFAVEVAYVGRLSHKLLAKADLGAPLVYLVDPISKANYAQSINQLYSATSAGSTPTTAAGLASVTPIAYFQNLFSNLAGTCGAILPNCTATQRVYQLVRNDFPSFTDALSTIDTRTRFSKLGRFTFFQPQFQSLPGWTNLGGSNYHALQLNVRKRLSHGLLFDFNYTYSKSIDNASAVENSARVTGQIADAFFPNNARGLSDFDLKHQMNLNGVYELPFGRGRRLGHDVPGWANQIIGGWQVSGILRWRGGFPNALENGFNFPTNFFLTGPGTQICPIKTNFQENGAGGPNLFGDATGRDAAFACLDFTRSGFSGSRNTIRGVRFANVDFGLRKQFGLPLEHHKLVFDWEVFNLANHPNFDDRTMRLNPESKGTFGLYTSTIGADARKNNGRVMQFGLRYEF